MKGVLAALALCLSVPSHAAVVFDEQIQPMRYERGNYGFQSAFEVDVPMVTLFRVSVFSAVDPLWKFYFPLIGSNGIYHDVEKRGGTMAENRTVGNGAIWVIGNFSVSQDAAARVVIEQLAVIPEPATWALMIAGFGMAGAMLRVRQPGMRKSEAPC